MDDGDDAHARDGQWASCEDGLFTALGAGTRVDFPCPQDDICGGNLPVCAPAVPLLAFAFCSIGRPRVRNQVPRNHSTSLDVLQENEDTLLDYEEEEDVSKEAAAGAGDAKRYE